ncbi:hypothetical protein [Meiothermus sp.]|uniref:hypothetical protein n=1 Tax=Meiothermus sp. TaxID=1955249 RepID=UPI0021DD883C|nr:hypothetical protein [Meiothermus sp.]GIW35073.1 MAG: hypothetical protein KatS3mg072_2406 [Meiothermus sp.]
MPHLKNPMLVQFWLWGQDALTGSLLAYGFQKNPSPTGRGSSLYLKGQVGLHSTAAWLLRSDGVLLYHRPSESFGWLENADGLPELSARRKPCDLDAGTEYFRPFVSAYEAWIAGRYGLDYRRQQLTNLPKLARSSLDIWEHWVQPILRESKVFPAQRSPF